MAVRRGCAGGEGAYPLDTQIRIRVQTEDPNRVDLGNGRFGFVMPNLIGLQLEVGRERLRALGVTTKEPQIRYASQPGCTANMICETYPAAMRQTDTTSDKILIVGAPPEPATVPATSKNPPASTRPGDLF